MNGEIERIEREKGSQLRICDLTFTLRLEKRATAKVYSLAYPVYGQEFHTIPLVNGRSRFNDLFEQFDPEAKQRAADELELDRLIGQCRGNTGEVRAVQEPVVKAVAVDDLLDELIEI
jgi:hypothetical protein